MTDMAGARMATSVVVHPSFLVSALELPKDTAKKVFKALRNLVENPKSPGLRLERLNGRASEFWSARVDDDFRIIYFQSESKTPVVSLESMTTHIGLPIEPLRLIDTKSTRRLSDFIRRCI